MELKQQIEQQRVWHIVSSYQLEGADSIAFNQYLKDLLATYPCPVIELALVEILVEGWLRLPMPKGCQFLARVYDRILAWQAHSPTSTIAPEQFFQITGLDPTPVFGDSHRSIAAVLNFGVS
ncbi:MAG TPA: hypothetical protein V6D18_10270 [Thermosynechococcaceae cyanobacterium]